MLRRSVLAVHAAALMLDADARPEDSALRAVRNGLPQTAEGRVIPEIKLSDRGLFDARKFKFMPLAIA